MKTFYADFKEKLNKTFGDEKEREYWSQDDLYKEKNKAELQELCRKSGVSAEGKKHECVKRLVEKINQNPPSALDGYDGKLSSLPHSVTELSKMSVYRLREILRFHNILDCGTKDELVLRIGMLRVGRSYLAFHKELEAIFNIVTATRTIILIEKDMYLEDPTIIHKRRKFSTPLNPSVSTSRPRDSASISSHQNKKAFLVVPEEITLETLVEVLDPLENEIGLYQQSNSKSKEDSSSTEESLTVDLEAIKALGARVLALWNKKEVGASGWKTGKHASISLHRRS